MFKKMTISVCLITLMLPLAHAGKVSCANFSTQAEAQAYMERYGAYWLDRDRDGEACECLPGGSKYGTSRCR